MRARESFLLDQFFEGGHRHEVVVDAVLLVEARLGVVQDTE
jgi:hypothetical protein